MSASGAARPLAAGFPHPGQGVVGDAAVWSPDGRSLVAIGDGSSCGICLVDATTGSDPRDRPRGGAGGGPAGRERGRHRRLDGRRLGAGRDPGTDKRRHPWSHRATRRSARCIRLDAVIDEVALTPDRTAFAFTRVEVVHHDPIDLVCPRRRDPASVRSSRPPIPGTTISPAGSRPPPPCPGPRARRPGQRGANARTVVLDQLRRRDDDRTPRCDGEAIPHDAPAEATAPSGSRPRAIAIPSRSASALMATTFFSVGFALPGLPGQELRAGAALRGPRARRHERRRTVVFSDCPTPTRGTADDQRPRTWRCDGVAK